MSDFDLDDVKDPAPETLGDDPEDAGPEVNAFEDSDSL